MRRVALSMTSAAAVKLVRASGNVASPPSRAIAERLLRAADAVLTLLASKLSFAPATADASAAAAAADEADEDAAFCAVTASAAAALAIDWADAAAADTLANALFNPLALRGHPSTNG